MIYVTGDTHGKSSRLSPEQIPFAENWGANDTLIVVGDFGFIMSGSMREELFLRELSFRPYTICFLDGNRENFDLLDAYPVTEWHGGKVQRIRKNVIHLMRGQVYELEGQRIFTMGGGYSVDKARRFEGVDWWPREMPNAEEYMEALENLKKVNNKVDVVLTHAAPTAVVSHILQCCPEEKELNEFLNLVKQTVTYERWFCGHLHLDAALPENLYALFLGVRDLITGEPVW